MRRTAVFFLVFASLFSLNTYADWEKIEHFPKGFDSLAFDEARGVFVTTRDQELWEASDGVWTNKGSVVPNTLHRFLIYDRQDNRVVFIARKNLLRKGNYVRSKHYYLWEIVNGEFVEKGSTKGLKIFDEQNIHRAFYCDALGRIVIVSMNRMIYSLNGTKWQLLSEGWSEEGSPGRILYDPGSDSIIVAWDTFKFAHQGGKKYQTWEFDIASNEWQKKHRDVFKKFEFPVSWYTKFTPHTDFPLTELVYMKRDGKSTGWYALVQWSGRKWKLTNGSKTQLSYYGATKSRFPSSNEFIVSVVRQEDAFVTWTWNGSEYKPYRLPWCNAESRSSLFYDSTSKRIGLVAQRGRYLNRQETFKYDIAVFWWDGNTWSNSGWTNINSLGLRVGHQVVYDTANDRIILFGGKHVESSSWSTDYTLTKYGDTWEFKGKRWKKLTNSGPEPRFNAAMATNTLTGEILLFGGSSEYYDHGVLMEGEKFGDTWLFDGTRWEQVAGQGPDPQDAARLAFDKNRNCFVLLGDSTWEFKNGTWTKVSDTGPGVNEWSGTGSLFYDAGRKAVVYFHSSSGNKAWRWTGTVWQSFSTAAEDVPFEFRATAVYDEANARIVAFDSAIHYSVAGNSQ